MEEARSSQLDAVFWLLLPAAGFQAQICPSRNQLDLQTHDFNHACFAYSTGIGSILNTPI